MITLNVEMPRMDGLTFLRKLMNQQPIPVGMCSSLTAHGSEAALKALQYGAVEIVAKPRLGVKNFLDESRILLCDAVRPQRPPGSGVWRSGVGRRNPS